MKRCIVAILALLYLSTSMGTTIYVHYCMGELVEWTLKDKKSATCSNCGMEKSSEGGRACCKDEQKQVKLDKHNRTVKSCFQWLKLIIHPISFSIPGLAPVRVFSVLHQNAIDSSPPGRASAALYIRNSVFLI